jgi:hypothetical protein
VDSNGWFHMEIESCITKLYINKCKYLHNSVWDVLCNLIFQFKNSFKLKLFKQQTVVTEPSMLTKLTMSMHDNAKILKE